MIKKSLPLISVIIPVYNVEKYIDKCIDTVCNQSYQNYEIILVDDGSTDSSRKKCDTYLKKDKRIKVFHKHNGGLSDARNYGVRKSNGDYIVFVDADDYVSRDYLEDLYRLLYAYKADVAVMRLCAVTEHRKVSFNSKKDVLASSRCLNSEKALEEMFYCKWGVTACGKIYKKSLVNVYPYPVGMLDEDLATTYKILGSCKRIAVTDKIDYAYVQRSGSITHRNITEQDLLGMTAAQEQLDYIKQRYPNIYLAALHRYAIQIVQYIPSILHGTKENKKIFNKLRAKLRPCYIQILCDSKVKLIKKIYFTTILFGYAPTVILWNLISVLKKIKVWMRDFRKWFM